jgi:hypothetical protein
LGITPLARRTLLACLGLLFGLALASAGQGGGEGARTGVLLQLAAAAISGLRWSLTQSFMAGGAPKFPQRDAAEAPAPSISGSIGNAMPSFVGFFFPRSSASAPVSAPVIVKVTPSATILATAPATLAVILPFAIFLEGQGLVSWLGMEGGPALLHASNLLCGIGMLVFLLLWTEYELVQSVGAVAVSVLFVVKELLTLVGGKIVYGDELSRTNVLGFCISQVALASFAHQRKHCSQPCTSSKRETDTLLPQ